MLAVYWSESSAQNINTANKIRNQNQSKSEMEEDITFRKGIRQGREMYGCRWT